MFGGGAPTKLALAGVLGPGPHTTLLGLSGPAAAKEY